MTTHLHTIDLNYLGQRGAIASYLLTDGSDHALIECGPSSTRERLVAGLREHGLEPGDISDVLVTHIHLDHAGSAGWWAGRGARVHVHAFGAPHLIDPTKLLNSARRIYGEDMDRLWGEIDPAPAELVHPIEDGDDIHAAGVTLRAIETPGHARHHHAFVTEIEGRRICFTGDAAAMIVPDRAYITIPAPPPEFDIEQWFDSIDRLIALDADRLMLTHFGPIDDPASHLEHLRRKLSEQFEFVRDQFDAGRDREHILADFTNWIRAEARSNGLSNAEVRAFLTGHLLAMSVDGMLRYLRKQEEASGARHQA